MPLEGEKSPPPYGRVDGFSKRASRGNTKHGMEESAAVIQSIITLLIGLVVGGVICFPLGIRYRKNVSEKEISSAEEEGKRIVNEAIKSAESKKREALLEAKEEILKNRSEYEKEVKERRADRKSVV